MAEQHTPTDTYQRIKRAAMCRTGLLLSAEEAWQLYWGDTGIKHVADTSDGWIGRNPKTCGTYGEQRRAAIQTTGGGKP
jgi:hypothetical protein